MPVIRVNERTVLLAFGGVAALTGAAILLFIALFLTFPVMAEPGSDHWGERNRPLAILAALAGLGLFALGLTWLARSLTWHGWAAIAGIVLLVAVAKGPRGSRLSEGSKPVGGPFYATSVSTPGNADTLMHAIYYRTATGMELVHDQAVDIEFVAPDCLTFHDLRVMGYAKYAMCGFRTPARSADSTKDHFLLPQARLQARYRRDWQRAR